MDTMISNADSSTHETDIKSWQLFLWSARANNEVNLKFQDWHNFSNYNQPDSHAEAKDAGHQNPIKSYQWGMISMTAENNGDSTDITFYSNYVQFGETKTLSRRILFSPSASVMIAGWLMPNGLWSTQAQYVGFIYQFVYETSSTLKEYDPDISTMSTCAYGDCLCENVIVDSCDD